MLRPQDTSTRERKSLNGLCGASPSTQMAKAGQRAGSRGLYLGPGDGSAGELQRHCSRRSRP